MNESEKLITSITTGTIEHRDDVGSSPETSDVNIKTNSNRQSFQTRRAAISQRFILVWLDNRINEVDDKNYHSKIAELQKVFTTINIFIDVDECIDFITDIEELQVFLVLSDKFVQAIVPVANELSQVNFIYILSVDNRQNEEWTRKWPKIKGAFEDISSICEVLEQDMQDHDKNSLPISIVKITGGATNQSLDTMDPSVMYTQLLKEILLTTDFNQGHFNEFITYCRAQLAGNDVALKHVDKIEKEYHHYSPIYWYSYDFFLYSMLNRSLRMMEIDVIINMCFFIRDLCHQIDKLHAQQYDEWDSTKSFTVYRGQALSLDDFDQLRRTRGGLMSFNSFLSTSLDREIAIVFAEYAQVNPDLIGVLFKLTINPAISSSSFACTTDPAAYSDEYEVLFSMHSVFRIGQIEKIENNDRLWQIELTLTTDSDPQLHTLTEYIRKEIFPDRDGWYRLGGLLLKMGHYEKAEQVFRTMLDQTRNAGEKPNICQMLGTIKYNDGMYTEAIMFYQKSIAMMQTILRPTHPDLAVSYRNIAAAYEKMGEYSKALLYHEKAIEMYHNNVSSNHLTFPSSSDNDNLMNATTDDCVRIISSYEGSTKILEKTLPQGDPSLARLYNDYGSACEKMGYNEKALSFYERALQIKQAYLPSNHPSLAASYANVATIHGNMGDQSTARAFDQRAFATAERSLPANHPDLRKYKRRLQDKTSEP